jgi:hypothetical protein
MCETAFLVSWATAESCFRLWRYTGLLVED